MFEEIKAPGEGDPKDPPEELSADLGLTGEEDAATLKTRLEEERRSRLDEAEARRQLTARAITAEEKLKKSRTAPPPPVSKKDDEEIGSISKRVDSIELLERKRQFGYENNLSPDETDAIFKLNPTPTKEVLDDPFVKGGVEAIRAKRRAESATPSSSSHSPKFEGKTYEELPLEEKNRNREAMIKSKIAARRGN